MIHEASQPTSASAAKRATSRYEVSVVIPAFNEEDGIAREIGELEKALRASGWEHEIIVVDDGSTDGTANLAEAQGVKVVRLPANRGYGAALKAGIAQAQSDWVAIVDADGTYPSAEIPRMLDRIPASDMVVGARIGWTVQDPLARRPVKWLLRKLAGYLAGCDIPDLNSGMRVIRKSLVERFADILPSGFSFTTTITLALISGGYSVAYVPIDYYKRVGRSKIKPSHAVKFAFQMLRTMMLFQPMRVLGPVAAMVGLAGAAKLTYDLFPYRVSGADIAILVQAILICSVALLAEQNARFHKHKR